MVYTIDDTLASGGHFLTLRTMHLTERALVVAVRSARAGSNAEHVQMLRAVARITIYVALDAADNSMCFNCNQLLVRGRSHALSDTVLRKPFLSMARMVLHPDAYRPGFTKRMSENCRKDMKNACWVVKQVLKHNNLPLKVCNLPKPLPNRRIFISNKLMVGKGYHKKVYPLENWEPIDSKTVKWNEPGTATLSVPTHLAALLIPGIY